MQDSSAKASISELGQRISAYRVGLGLSQQTLADRAGMSRGYLAGIESGNKRLNTRSVLERIAEALEMTSSELTGGALGNGLTKEHAAISRLRLVLTDLEIGEAVERRVTASWQEVTVRVEQANQRRHRADYAQQGELLPDLIYDLHGHLSGPHQRDAVIGLVYAYYAAGVTCKNLGSSDLMLVAASHIRRLTEMVDEPEWIGMGAWMQTQTIGRVARERAYRGATRAAEALARQLDDPDRIEMCGSLHLAASLAATSVGRKSDAEMHLNEALDLVRHSQGRNFGELWFGRGNVAIWQAYLFVESGQGPKALELARTIDPDTLPVAPIRRADWWVTLGRGMATSPKDGLRALEMFQRAEKLAPQRVRTNTLVREITGGVLTRLRVNAIPASARAFAVRMGRAVA